VIERVYIKDYVTFEEVELEFQKVELEFSKGLIVFTGPSGAGNKDGTCSGGAVCRHPYCTGRHQGPECTRPRLTSIKSTCPLTHLAVGTRHASASHLITGIA